MSVNNKTMLSLADRIAILEKGYDDSLILKDRIGQLESNSGDSVSRIEKLEANHTVVESRLASVETNTNALATRISTVETGTAETPVVAKAETTDTAFTQPTKVIPQS